MTAGQLDPQHSSQQMSRVTGQRRDHGTAVLVNGTPLSDELSYTHSMLPSNSPVMLPLLCLLNHIIDQIYSPSLSPWPVWYPPPQRDVFERLPQQRDKPSWACLWPSPPSPIESPAGSACLVNAYAPMSSVSFPMADFHSKTWLSKEAHWMLPVRIFKRPPSTLPYTYILLPPSDTATGTAWKTVIKEHFHLPVPPPLTVSFITVFCFFATSVSWALKHCHWLPADMYITCVSVPPCPVNWWTWPISLPCHLVSSFLQPSLEAQAEWALDLVVFCSANSFRELW